jgi:hypothetical protein
MKHAETIIIPFTDKYTAHDCFCKSVSVSDFLENQVSFNCDLLYIVTEFQYASSVGPNYTVSNSGVTFIGDLWQQSVLSLKKVCKLENFEKC